MTNGTVGSTGGGTTYTIQYQGGTQTIVVPEGTPVVTNVQGDTSLPPQAEPALSQ